jgi:hypothetical protein
VERVGGYGISIDYKQKDLTCSNIKVGFRGIEQE